MDRFWETKAFDEMTLREWEALCDGCGRCCLEKYEYEETGEVVYSVVSCQFLDTTNCRCLIYEDRHNLNSVCTELTRENIKELTWLPETCAYRRLFEGQNLESWHPLVSGNTNSVHAAGISIKEKVIPGRFIHPDDRD